MPTPDRFGRFRVRAKSGHSGIWSTRNFNPKLHEIVPGPASDTYGAALPPKPHVELKQLGKQGKPSDKESI